MSNGDNDFVELTLEPFISFPEVNSTGARGMMGPFFTI